MKKKKKKKKKKKTKQELKKEKKKKELTDYMIYICLFFMFTFVFNCQTFLSQPPNPSFDSSTPPHPPLLKKKFGFTVSTGFSMFVTPSVCRNNFVHARKCIAMREFRIFIYLFFFFIFRAIKGCTYFNFVFCFW